MNEIKTELDNHSQNIADYATIILSLHDPLDLIERMQHQLSHNPSPPSVAEISAKVSEINCAQMLAIFVLSHIAETAPRLGISTEEFLARMHGAASDFFATRH